MVRSTWWRCPKALLFISLLDVFIPVELLVLHVLGHSLSVLLFHVAKLALTGHPFLRKTNPWSHGIVVKMASCVMGVWSPLSILDSSQTSGTVFSFFYPEYHSYGPEWLKKDESTSCLVCRIQTTHGMGERSNRIWIYFMYQLQQLRCADRSLSVPYSGL